MYRKKPIYLLLFLMLFSFTISVSASSPESDKNIQKLIAHFEKKGIDLKPYLEDSRYELLEGITKKFTGAAEKTIESFADYQKVLGYDRKSEKLPLFLETYSKELAAAEREYGIPKEVIAGIIGVESEFGKYFGTYNPFNVYVSMYALDYRAKFALAQLEELLEFTKKNNLDVHELKSSYAGAMSYAQFIPYSLNRWWIGSDLYHMPNNIQSVGNYLAHFKDITGTTEKAILRYNNSELYQQAVLSLAKEAKALGE